MAERVVLHVGAPKSGTTYLQSVLFASRASLREHGVLVPGAGVADYSRAARAMRTPRLGDGPAGRTWRAMLEEVGAWPGTAVLSSEWFCLTPRGLVPRALEQLAPADVEVVYTARALVEQVPAAWQETLKLGSGHDLAGFVDALPADGERWSWWSLDAARVLQRWSPPLPAGKVTVVTVPRTRDDPDLLLRRFTTACGVDPAWCDTSRAAPNESLSVEAAVLAARLAPEIDRRIDFSSEPWTDRYRWLRRTLGHEVLVPQPGRPIGLPAEVEQALLRRAETVVDRLGRAGYRVEGDLDELLGPTRRPGALAPSQVPDGDVLDVAVATVVELLARLREETLRHERGRGSRTDGRA